MKINTVEPMAEANSETCQTSKMERFAKIVNDFQLLTILAKCSLIDVWQGSEYASKQPALQKTQVKSFYLVKGSPHLLRKVGLNTKLFLSRFFCIRNEYKVFPAEAQYLEPCQTNQMELFGKNSEPLKAVNYFHKKAPI